MGGSTLERWVGPTVRPAWTGLMRGGAPGWRVAPALSLSLWRWMPVISRPLSESILGIRATRASTERPVSLFRLTTFWLFFPPGFVLFLCLIFPCVCSPIFESHVMLKVVSWPKSIELFAPNQNCPDLRSSILFGFAFVFLIGIYFWVKC